MNNASNGTMTVLVVGGINYETLRITSGDHKKEVHYSRYFCFDYVS